MQGQRAEALHRTFPRARFLCLTLAAGLLAPAVNDVVLWAVNRPQNEPSGLPFLHGPALVALGAVLLSLEAVLYARLTVAAPRPRAAVAMAVLLTLAMMIVVAFAAFLVAVSEFYANCPSYCD